MRHLFLLLRFLVLGIGFTALFALVMTWIKTRNRAYLFFSIYIGSLNLTLLLKVVSMYLSVNVSHQSLIESSLLLRFVINMIVFVIGLFVILTFFSFITWRYSKHIILLSLAVFILMFIAQSTLFLIDPEYTFTFYRISASITFVYLILCTTLYFIIGLKEKITGLLLAAYPIYMLFLPFLMLDVFRGYFQNFFPEITIDFRFILLFYLLWNIYSLIVAVRNLLETSRMPAELIIPERILDKYYITRREKEIIELVIRGYSNQQIADKAFISLGTVKTHLNSIFKKMELKGRLALLSFIQKNQ
jgi:DNA-binding CsgD family transcriptional regulator